MIDLNKFIQLLIKKKVWVNKENEFEYFNPEEGYGTFEELNSDDAEQCMKYFFQEESLNDEETERLLYKESAKFSW